MKNSQLLFLLCLIFFVGEVVDTASAQSRRKPKTYHTTDEVNAVWIATVSNLNWPSKPGLTPQQQQAEATAILDRARSLGMNMIVFQVRPTGDAFYRSEFFPWSHCLSGVQGKDPGYDPLEFWIVQSHRRGMALHAWINPYRLSTRGGGDKADLNPFVENHPARKHPDWVVPYADGKLYFNPGIPACRDFVVQAALEIVKKYDVDGIHMDDYFYPYPQKDAVFDDAKAFSSFAGEFVRSQGLAGKTPKEQLDRWRRHNVNLMIRDIHRGIEKIKPDVLFGVSPFGIWRNRATDPTGSDTKGLQSYDAIYADTKFWIENGIVDYIVPQLYWPIGFDVADYAKLADWWSRLAEQNPRVQLYIGLAVHRVGGAEGTAWQGSEEIVRQVRLNRSHPAIKGQFYFGWPSLAQNKAGVADNIQKLIAANQSGVEKKKAELKSVAPQFKRDSVSVFLNPSLQPKNIGFGDYGTEEQRMHELSAIVRKELLKHGVKVYENRIGMTLQESIALSNEKNPTIHVSLHSNAFDKSVRGVETYHRAKGEKVDECRRLASKLYNGLLEIYDGPRRGVKPTDNLIEPRTVTAPNTLVEVAFHDNETDARWILDNMDLIGRTLARSIVEFLAEEHPHAVVSTTAQ